jgi:hypothetical protein
MVPKYRIKCIYVFPSTSYLVTIPPALEAISSGKIKKTGLQMNRSRQKPVAKRGVILRSIKT